MADLDAFTIGVIIMIVVIIVIAFLEMKYLRKSMKARRGRASKRIAGMPDDAPNALLPAKKSPPNYAQARFTIDIAREGIAKGRADAKDIAAAEGWLAKAQARFEAKDFNAALPAPRQAHGGAG